MTMTPEQTTPTPTPAPTPASGFTLLRDEQGRLIGGSGTLPGPTTGGGTAANATQGQRIFDYVKLRYGSWIADRVRQLAEREIDPSGKTPEQIDKLYQNLWDTPGFFGMIDRAKDDNERNQREEFNATWSRIIAPLKAQKAVSLNPDSVQHTIDALENKRQTYYDEWADGLEDEFDPKDEQVAARAQSLRRFISDRSSTWLAANRPDLDSNDPEYWDSNSGILQAAAQEGTLLGQRDAKLGRFESLRKITETNVLKLLDGTYDSELSAPMETYILAALRDPNLKDQFYASGLDPTMFLSMTLDPLLQPIIDNSPYAGVFQPGNPNGTLAGIKVARANNAQNAKQVTARNDYRIGFDSNFGSLPDDVQRRLEEQGITADSIMDQAKGDISTANTLYRNAVKAATNESSKASFVQGGKLDLALSDLPPEVQKKYQDTLATTYEFAKANGLDPAEYVKKLLGLELGQAQKAHDEMRAGLEGQRQLGNAQAQGLTPFAGETEAQMLARRTAASGPQPGVGNTVGQSPGQSQAYATLGIDPNNTGVIPNGTATGGLLQWFSQTRGYTSLSQQEKADALAMLEEAKKINPGLYEGSISGSVEHLASILTTVKNKTALAGVAASNLGLTPAEHAARMAAAKAAGRNPNDVSHLYSADEAIAKAVAEATNAGKTLTESEKQKIGQQELEKGAGAQNMAAANQPKPTPTPQPTGPTPVPVVKPTKKVF